MAMDREQQIDQLRRQLKWEGAGPLAEITKQVTHSLARIAAFTVGWIRRSGQQNPLITFLLACGVGFAVGRRGGRHA